MQHLVRKRHVSEDSLRTVWHSLTFDTSRLRTSGGESVEILSQGEPNPDGGPDFRNARIRIGGKLFHGDVELHTGTAHWHQHAHHRDKKYNRVILHVVLTAQVPFQPSLTESERAVPVLVLSEFFTNASEAVMRTSKTSDTILIPCFPANSAVNKETIHSWLEKMAAERMELKVRRFEERLKELVRMEQQGVSEPYRSYGRVAFGINPGELPPPVSELTAKDMARISLWEQLLHEGIMEALGYAKNELPFLKLARDLPLGTSGQYLTATTEEDRILDAEALLFGVAGLLPPVSVTTETTGRKRLRQLRGRWFRIRKTYRGPRLHEADWQFFRLRPENFPTLRLAAAAHLITTFRTTSLFKEIIRRIKETEGDAGGTIRAFRSLFIIPADDFWSCHYRFQELSRRPIRSLIGRSRAHDIILNAVIPVALLYARVFRDRAVRTGAILLYKSFPQLMGNHILRTVSEQVTRSRIVLDSAYMQQGAIQLYRCYCMEQRCRECAVGRMVFQF